MAAVAMASFAAGFVGSAYVFTRPASPPGYHCDDQGRFIVTDDMPYEVKAELLGRNIALTRRRVEALSGQIVWDHERLAKAEGCR